MRKESRLGMMNENVLAKLKILAESAKYDVSCSSSGTVRSNKPGTLGNTVGGWGICHSFAEDGRCISLLKIMLTNYCIYDCAYCVNRRSNDLPRATFSVSELVELTMEFYRRNYIEGLFLSSGVVRNPDYTMERLVRVAKDLRQVYRFNGYIHLKSIPGASRELVNEAGLYADLKYLKQLYSEGLLNPESFTQDKNNQVNINEAGDECVIGAFLAQRPGYACDLTTEPYSDKWKQYQSLALRDGRL